VIVIDGILVIPCRVLSRLSVTVSDESDVSPVPEKADN